MSIKKPELHIFAYSSSKVYGCAVYFRVVENNKAKVSFVIGKIRLAPLKEKLLSIPKLELHAAVTATRIKTMLLEETNFDVKRIYFWSDSKTVLKYIYNEKKHFPVYVMHRLDEIRSNSNITDWNYIPTHHNISDACTRPIDFIDFKDRNDYLCGPRFLQANEINEYIGAGKIYHDPEISLSTHKVLNSEIDNFTVNDTRKSIIAWNNFSSWIKLLKVISFLKHLIQRFKRHKKIIDNKLSEPTRVIAEHMNNTHDVIIELIQKETFKQGLQDLFSSSQVNQNSKLVTLNPILDNNIIKVGGPLKNIIGIPNNLKHQIILPRHHPVTDLLILHYHKSNHHCGRDQTPALLRERYWIVKAKSIIRLLCKHARSMPKPQLMGNLPKERIAVFKPPFTITGVDCFGPVTIKQYKRTRTSSNKQIKRYGIIFTCLTTRAVHLELSIDMITDGFLMTLRRFIARRGEPDIIW